MTVIKMRFSATCAAAKLRLQRLLYARSCAVKPSQFGCIVNACGTRSKRSTQSRRDCLPGHILLWGETSVMNCVRLRSTGEQLGFIVCEIGRCANGVDHGRHFVKGLALEHLEVAWRMRHAVGSRGLPLPWPEPRAAVAAALHRLNTNDQIMGGWWLCGRVRQLEPPAAPRLRKHHLAGAK